MLTDYLLAGVVTLITVGYLVFALIFPERL